MLNLARVLVLVGALCVIALGFLVGSLGILASFLDPTGDRLTMVTISVSFMALSMGLGSMLAWQTWKAIQGKESRPFRPRWVWVSFLVFPLAVLAGQSVLRLDLLPPLIFPPLHVVAAVLPPLTVIALVSKTLGGTSRQRDVVFQTSSGAFLSTFLAFTLEFAFVLGLLLTILTFVALQSGGLEQIQALAARLQDPTWLENPAELASMAVSPLVLASAFLVFAIVVPLIEEAVKTVGVGLMAYRRPRLSQAFLWGLAGGAGFALAEGLLNSIGGLDAWALTVSARVGATLVHCFTGALMGLAWYAVLTDRRWGRALGLYAVSVGIHGLWNALTAGMAFISLGVLGSQATGTGQTLAEVSIAVIVAMLVSLTLAVALGLIGLTRHVRRRCLAIEASRPAPGLSPSDPVP